MNLSPLFKPWWRVFLWPVITWGLLKTLTRKVAENSWMVWIRFTDRIYTQEGRLYRELYLANKEYINNAKR